MRYLFLLLVLTACSSPPPLREYVVTCPVMNPREPQVIDTIVTTAYLHLTRTQYRIGGTYYPSTCIIKTKIITEVRNVQ